MDSTNGPVDDAIDLSAPARVAAVINGGVVEDSADADVEPLLYGDINDAVNDEVDGVGGDTAETINDLSSIVGDGSAPTAAAMDVSSDSDDLDNGIAEAGRGEVNNSDLDTVSMVNFRRRQ